MKYRLPIYVVLASTFLAGIPVLRAQTILPAYGPSVKYTATILPARTIRKPKVALVLSGGAARGLAHIGVLRSLERHGIPISMIIGTSMGSIIGGLYASGYSPAELQTIADTVNWNDLLSLSDEERRSNLFLEQRTQEERSFLTIRFKNFSPIIPSSVSTAQRLTKFINGLVLRAVYHADSSFDELRVPFRAVTTDLISGKRVLLSNGDLTEALRASATIPLLFSPVNRDSTLLLDGGLISNIPVDVARELGADIVIAVNVTSSVRKIESVRYPWEMADQIMSIMMQIPNRIQLQNADVVISPALGERAVSDFSGVDSLIDDGDRSADSAIALLQEKIRSTPAVQPLSTDPLPNPKLEFVGDLASLPAVQQSFLRHIYSAGISPEAIRGELDRLYESGDYSDVRATIQSEDSATVVLVRATVNPKLNGAVFFNNLMIPSDSLRRVFTGMMGKPINERETKNALEGIIGMYRSKGYVLARIDSLAYDPVTGIVSFWIDEGRIAYRKIEGNERTKLFVIFREVLIDEGEVFTIDEAMQSLTNIISTNLFEQVILSVRYENRRPVLIINVEERSPELIRLGIHLDNEGGLQYSVDGRDQNFLGTATEFGGIFTGGERNQLYKLEYKSNRLFDTYLTFNLSGYYRFRNIFTYSDELGLPTSQWNRIQTGEYREIKYGGAFSFGTQLERLGNVSLEGRFEQQQLRDLKGTGAVAGFSADRYKLAALRLGSTVDTQDKYPYPNDGILLNLYYEVASKALGGDIAYSKLFISYEQFRTHHLTQLTFHPRIIFGYADERLPLAEQFSFGGQKLFFGLRDDDNRGRQIFLLNVETRWHSPLSLLFETYLSLRYDVGSVWRVAEDIKVRDFQHGLGFTLSLDTPVGPADFSIGRSFIFRRDLPANPISLGPFRFYVTIGCRI